MTRSSKLWMAIASIPFLLVILMTVSEFIYEFKLKPDINQTYDAWEKTFGKPDGQIRQFKHADALFYEVRPVLKPFFLTVPAGAPSYIFNRFGILTDWSADPQNAPDFYLKWGLLNVNARPIAYHAFIRLICASRTDTVLQSIPNATLKEIK